ncbi:MAG TPA: acyltransferase family protein [Veillonellaceae bacterium]|nr:acyltransferase family protein [Veillonellaceae bacterium]
MNKAVNTHVRNSSIELLRIIAILIIIAHHFCAHGLILSPLKQSSGLMEHIFSWQVMTVKLLDCEGVGISLFMLITGYFMVHKKVNIKRILLLLSTMFFYSWLILLFAKIEFPEMVSKDIVKMNLIPIFYGLDWFVSCYILFTLFIPFINSFLTSLSKDRYLSFLLILFTVYAILPVIGMNNFINSNRLMFFFLVYSIGAYLRLHYQDKIKSIYHKKYRSILIFALILIFLGKGSLEVMGDILNRPDFIISKTSLYFGEVVGIPLATIMFLTFTTMKMRYNKYINVLAGTVLGVYLIHDNDFFMRRIIWDHIFPNLNYITSDYYLLFWAAKILGVFIVCSAIDFLRGKYIEPHIERFIDRHFDSWLGYWNRMVLKVRAVIHI